jgi:hypothetical protein
MSHIAAHQQSNAQISSPHIGKDFLFCADGSDLARRVAALRSNFALDSSPRRNAGCARTLAQALRKRHRHLSCCTVCVLREVFDGALPQ